VRASGAAVGAKQKRQRLSGEGEDDEERVAVWEEAAKKTTKEKDDDDKEEEEEEGGGKEEENTNRPKTDTAMGEAAQILVRQRVSKRGRSDHVTADEEAQDEELANANRGLPGEGSSDEEEEEDASDDDEEKDASDDHGGRKKFVLRVFPVLASRFVPLLFVSARTNKRNHHRDAKEIAAVSVERDRGRREHDIYASSGADRQVYSANYYAKISGGNND
jgi:hypothetical protein